MPIITIFSASFCHGDQITEKIAQKLGYQKIGEEILQKAETDYQIPYQKLDRAMHGAPSFLNNLTHEKEQCVAYIQAAFAEYLRTDNLVYHGFAGHLLPKYLNNILRVCIVANREDRIKTAMQETGISEKKAESQIEKNDIESYRWTQYLFNFGPWDKRLYDLKIPLHEFALDDAVQLICDNESKIKAQTPENMDQIIEDFVLASKVNVTLAENGYHYEVTCDQGHVLITVKEFRWRREKLQEKLKELAQNVEGVKNVEIRIGTDQQQPKDRYIFDVHPKVLLVDDEKEFVLTLSERLQMRDFQPQVVYDGEQALSFVKNDEPDVVVLDLMMPGIHGIDVLRQLKKEHPNVEVIILTGHGSQKDRMIAEDLGAFAYLEKPVEIDKLSQTMKKAYQKIQEKMTSSETTDFE